ncbi:MAG TPA: LpqB family beta-propeller domain-containing protein [Gemmatimonadales bacterium]|nr:LpqB family beta-propeller domain-containing protein [Gemmatimonadales bacterium]
MSTIPERLTAALAERYRIERELGAGGMATVYLAQDLKHDRRVAIKVLRPELAAVIGAERFLREIKTIANLSHPHILGLIDSGEVSGTAYYVMPFVEGESLRARLSREKQLPINEAVRLATEIAGALDYAHRHGVIHRDIKPENILLHDGAALVADFGIALAVSSAGGTRMTETGMSLGTPHYMSPEQAMGEREITGRSDIYALGCLTYEMLVGDPPFTGSTAQAIVAKVMTEKPAPPSRFRETVPAAVEEAVLTALAKLPADRFATAAEFATALAGGGSSTGRFGGAAHARVPASSPGRRLVIGGALVALPLIGFALGRLLGRSHQTELPPSRLSVLAPFLGSSGLARFRQIAITPAGDAIVYAGASGSTTNSLYLQRLDATDPVEIAGSTSLGGVAITSDGRTVLGTTLNSGYRIPIEGGTPRQSPLPANNLGGNWGPDGSYWFTESNATGIVRLTPGDSLIPIPLPREKARGLRIQQVLDAGRMALVTNAPSGTASGPGLLLDLKTGETTTIVDRPVVELRSVAGELLCVLPDGSITAAPFDTRRYRILGPAVQIATGVALTGTGIAQFSVADNGTLAYIPESPRSLVLIDRSGNARTVLAEQPNVHAPHFSPDGRRISFDITSAEGRDVWTYTLDQHTISRATFAHDGHDATWTPDGQLLTYASFKSGVLGIYRTRPGSTQPAESLLASDRLTYTGTWLRDGSALITNGNDLQGASNSDIVRVANGGRGPIEPLVASTYLESYAAPSPDGRWLAFASDQSGRQEVYVQPMDGKGDQVQVSQEGATEPVWGPDGRELFYRANRAGQAVLAVTTLRTAPSLAIVSQQVLFPISDMVGTAPHANFDIAPDGRTFAMVRRSPGSRIVVIQNLPGLLRRLRGPATATP